jgi:hypothetical protein
MGLFGWSYPPGAAGDPNAPYNQEDPHCAVCGKFVDDCICPECKTCGGVGDPWCYEAHGMVRTSAQIASLAETEARWAEDARQQAEAEAAMGDLWANAY